MQSLKDVLAALRREIEEGIRGNQPLSSGTRIEADRVIVNLQFSIKDSAAKNGTSPIHFEVQSGEIQKASPAEKHSLSVEFKVAGEATSTTAVTAAPAKQVFEKGIPLQGTEATRAQEQLALVFGAPGFDSSARATVFREVLGNLSARDVPAVAAALIDSPRLPIKPTVKSAIARLDRILKSGPSGVSDGRAIVAKLLERHPSTALVELVAKLWKSQEDWIS